MANKTVATDADVCAYLAGIEPEERRRDAEVLIALMGRLSGDEPKLWGPSIIGFGSHHYRYDSGREGDMPRVAFAPRKAQLVLYCLGLHGMGGPERRPDLFGKLGRHTAGKGCLYVKRLTDLDMAVLEELILCALEARPEC